MKQTVVVECCVCVVFVDVVGSSSVSVIIIIIMYTYMDCYIIVGLSRYFL